MRLTILDDYQGVALSMADWSSVSARVEIETLASPLRGDALVEALAQSDIVVAMRERTAFDAALFRRLPKLRLLVTTGMRNASIDLDGARAAGVVVCGTPGSGSPTAELTFGLILAMARHIGKEAANVREGGWQTSMGRDLEGARLGVVGLGKLGARVARIGAAFGMEVVAWSPNLTPERALAAGARAVSKAELFSTSEFVTLHLVLSERSAGVVDAEAIAAMRPDAFLINTSRAGLVDNAALTEALLAGRIAGAGLDVFEQEPLPPNHPMRSLPNVLATPHLGYVTNASYRTYFGGVVEDIEAFLDGAPIRVLT